jgi:hypothetical protein
MSFCRTCLIYYDIVIKICLQNHCWFEEFKKLQNVGFEPKKRFYNIGIQRRNIVIPLAVTQRVVTSLNVAIERVGEQHMVVINFSGQSFVYHQVINCSFLFCYHS